MASKKLIDGIYSVGMLNPNMRIFDVVMRTDYGTTYNSYIVKNGTKAALIETSHADFFDRYLDNIREVCDPGEIEYIILNHCEPDHSGALEELSKHCPNAKIVVSRAGSIYLKNITNLEALDCIVVKEGDTLDLDGLELQFRMAPFLHWPDSMFTYVAEKKTLFTCDFFGAHYCEPYVFDTEIQYPNAYDTALKGYYDAIFGPFRKYVVNGLTIAGEMEFDRICTSHGPVLTKEGKLDAVLAQYEDWSREPVPASEIPVFYCSAYGNTTKLAQSIAKGLELQGKQAQCYDLNEHPMEHLQALINSAPAFAIGAPTINADAPAPVWQLLSHVDAINAKNKPALVFGSYGWSGEAVPNITARLTSLKIKPFAEPVKTMFVPTEADLQAAEQTGSAFGAAF